MRYLLDTNIFIYLATDVTTLDIPLISSDTRFPFYEKQGLKLVFNKK